MKTISVVIPCFNEQEVIPIYYEKMAEIMARMTDVAFELLFVDDGSQDGTLQCLSALHERDPRCRCLSLSRNFGKEAALYAGMRQAGGDYVAVMDVDLQDPPELLPRMYEELRRGGCDCVAARRVDRDGEKKVRSVLSRLFYRVIRCLSDVPVMEGARDFRLMSRVMADAVLQVGEYNRFSKGIFSWVGFRTKWLEYRNCRRAAGETKWPLRKLVRYALDGILSFSSLPLALPLYGGLACCVVTLLSVCVLAVRALFWHAAVSAWAILLAGLFLVGGLQLLCMGILGQYLARVYLEVKHRPIYIQRKREENGDGAERSEQAASSAP